MQCLKYEEKGDFSVDQKSFKSQYNFNILECKLKKGALVRQHYGLVYSQGL